jgi:hypothetical protein
MPIEEMLDRYVQESGLAPSSGVTRGAGENSYGGGAGPSRKSPSALMGEGLIAGSENRFASRSKVLQGDMDSSKNLVDRHLF